MVTFLPRMVPTIPKSADSLLVRIFYVTRFSSGNAFLRNKFTSGLSIPTSRSSKISVRYQIFSLSSLASIFTYHWWLMGLRAMFSSGKYLYDYYYFAKIHFLSYIASCRIYYLSHFVQGRSSFFKPIQFFG